jgi:hypothetical protein
MKLSYPQAKVEMLEVIDDFASLIDVMAGYGSPGRYNARTRLSEIGLDEPVRAMMHKRVNKTFAKITGWKNVEPEEIMGCEVIGDLVVLVCLHGDISIPGGEPK